MRSFAALLPLAAAALAHATPIAVPWNQQQQPAWSGVRTCFTNGAYTCIFVSQDVTCKGDSIWPNVQNDYTSPYYVVPVDWRNNPTVVDCSARQSSDVSVRFLYDANAGDYKAWLRAAYNPYMTLQVFPPTGDASPVDPNHIIQEPGTRLDVQANKPIVWAVRTVSFVPLQKVPAQVQTYSQPYWPNGVRYNWQWDRYFQHQSDFAPSTQAPAPGSAPPIGGASATIPVPTATSFDKWSWAIESKTSGKNATVVPSNSILPQDVKQDVGTVKLEKLVDADKPKPDADKPKPDADKPKPEADKTKPEADKTKPEADKTKPDDGKEKPQPPK